MLLKSNTGKNNIYILKLNVFNILFAYMFRLIGLNVYYLTLPLYWQKQNIINKLSKAGIIWMNYQDYDIDKPMKLYLKAKNIREYISSFLKCSAIIEPLRNQLHVHESEEYSLNQLIISSMESRIILMAELFIFSDLIEGDNLNRRLLWAPKDIISQKILEQEGNWKNIFPKWLGIIYYFSAGVNIIRSLIIFKLININYSIYLKNIFFYKKFNKSVEYDGESVLSNYKIIFFPHQGIYYGDLFIKDHFYAADPKSPYYHSNIMHFSIYENNSSITSSIKYYKKYNIPYSDWSVVSSMKHIKLIIMSSIFITRCLSKYWKMIDLYLLFKLVYNYINIVVHIHKLKQFPYLQIILIGYDVLFPIQLALACRIMRINTVAVQERMALAWFYRPLIVDYYFIYGQASMEILDERYKSLIKEKHFVGPIRLGNHYEIINKCQHYKKYLPDYKFRVLVLDSHSVSDHYMNGRTFGSNWKNNIRFYNDIIKLCLSFPKTYFMIKGKNIDFTKIPYFSDVVKKISVTHNCMLVNDYKKWTPYTATAVCDIAIATHTSLGDEILAIGKPVIFYDLTGMPSQILDYGDQIVSFTLEDIKLKLSSFLKEPKKYNQRLEPIRKKYYYYSKITPKNILNQKLTQIFNED